MSNYLTDKDKLDEDYKSLMAYAYLIRNCSDVNNITDNQFFKCGLYSNLISNCVSVIINLLMDNVNTIGIDNNCRAILEALGILEMDRKGDINDEAKKLYRLSPLSVDYGNIPNSEKNYQNLSRTYVNSQKYNDYKKAVMKHFRCPENKLTDKILCDPCLYLRNSINDDSEIVSILKKHNIDLNKSHNYYRLFSFMIHPRCEVNLRVENRNMLIRDEAVSKVLSYAIDFVKSKIPAIDTQNVKPFKYQLGEHINILQCIIKVHKTCDKIVDICEESKEYMASFFFRKSRAVFQDMLCCYAIGLYDMVSVKFKSLIELHAVMIRIQSIKGRNKRYYKTLGYTSGSRLRFKSIVTKNKNTHIADSMYDDLNFIFNEYYQKHYKLDNIDQMIDGLINYSYYAIDEKEKDISLNKIVERDVKQFTSTPTQFDEVLGLYSASIDLEHASGFTFSQAESMSYFYAMNILCESASIIATSLASFEDSIKSTIGIDISEDVEYLNNVAIEFGKALDNFVDSLSTTKRN